MDLTAPLLPPHTQGTRGEIQFHRVTLAFLDPALERRFAAHRDAASYAIVTLSMLLVGLLAMFTDMRCVLDVRESCGVMLGFSWLVLALALARVLRWRARAALLQAVRTTAFAVGLGVPLLLPAEPWALLVMMAAVPAALSTYLLTEPSFRRAAPSVVVFSCAFLLCVHLSDTITVIESFDIVHASLAVVFYVAWSAVVSLMLLFKAEAASRRSFALQEALERENVALHMKAEPLGVAALDRWLDGLSAHEAAPTSLLLDPARLHVGERLASGSSGQVFRGHYGDTPVAVKELFEFLMTGDLTTLARECSALAQVNSPFVVQFIGVTRVDDRVFVVTELCDASLQQVLAGEAPAQAPPLTTARQLAAALQLCHIHGVVHADVKPANVLVKGGVAKLADFGLAAVEGARRAPDEEGGGSPAFMAPELLRGGAPQRASDVYALGVVLWCLCADSDNPYPGDLAGRVGPQVLAGRRPEMPPGAPPIIARCLLEDPAARPTIDECVEALGGLESLGSLGGAGGVGVGGASGVRSGSRIEPLQLA